MINNNKTKHLIEQLEKEISLITDLNSLLSEEKIILATRQFDKLEDVAEKKQLLSAQLEESANKRLDLMNHSATNQNTANESLQDFLRSCSPEESNVISQLNTALAEQLNLCRELNTVNGQVIANNIYTRQQIINALSGNKNEASEVYNATGGIDKATGNNHHQKA